MIIVDAIKMIVLFILLFYVGAWVLRYVVNPAFENKRMYNEASDFVKRCKIVFDALYNGVDAEAVSKQAQKQLKNNPDNILLYGEISFLSFADILTVVKPRAGEVFYDLGSGGGKAVFAAALIGNFSKVVGVELLPSLFQLCNDQLHKFRYLPEREKQFPARLFNIQFVNDSFFNVSLVEADIIFINATAFRGSFWNAILAKLEETKVGTRFIVTSHSLPEPHFKLMEAQRRLMSWGMNSVYIYEKVDPEAANAEKPARSAFRTP